MDWKILKLVKLLIFIICVCLDGTVYNQTLDGKIHGDEGLTNIQKQLILALHNHYRSNVYPTAANMQKLNWDDTLENITKTYVEKCQLAHNKQRHQLYDRLSSSKNFMQNQRHIWVGENIAWGSGTCVGPNGTTFQCGDIFEGIKRWIQQSKKFNYDKNECSGKCSLYTQMIWAETNRMACAAKKCSEDKTILICNYFPGGNIPSTQPYIKGSVCSQCPEQYSNCEKALCSERLETSKKVDIMRSTVSEPLTLYDCQDQSYIYTTSASEIKIDSLNENSTPLQFEIPFDGKEIVDKYILCYDILWAVTINNTLLARYIKKYSDWTYMTSPEPINSVSCANNQIVWILTTKGNIFVRHLSEITKMNNNDWWKLPNGIKIFKSITCGEGSCWAVSDKNETFSRNNINRENPFGNFWKSDSIQLQSIVSNKQDILIGTTVDQNFKYKMFPDGNHWIELNKTSLDNLVFCFDEVVELIQQEHKIKKFSNKEFFKIQDKPHNSKSSSNQGSVSIVTDSDNIALFNTMPFAGDTESNKAKKDFADDKVDDTMTANNFENNQHHSEKDIILETPKNEIQKTNNELGSHEKPNIDLFYEKNIPKSEAVPTIKPILPPLPQYTLPIGNFDPSSDFHFVDGFKGVNNIEITNKATNMNSPLCCSLPDSVCPDHTNGCDAYIVCNGHNPISKRCEIGNVFDPTLNICTPKDQTHFFCDTPSVPLVFDTNTIPATVAPTFNQVEFYQPSKLNENLPISLNIQPPIQIPPPTPVTIQPPVLSEVSNDVRWSNFELNLHDYYIQPRVSIEKNESNFGVLREAWFNLGTSSSLDYLYNNSRYPDSPDEFLILDSFEAPPNAGDAYGQRLSAYFKPNISGEYIFYMSCDNECDLRLSEDESEDNLNTLISLRRGHYSAFRQKTKYSTAQKSKSINLEKNKLYLMQATMKEGTVVDHLTVSIEYPNKYIDEPARYNLLLVPEPLNATKSENIRWDSDIGKKNLVANKYIKRNKIKRHQN